MKTSAQSLLAGRLLARSALWNLLGVAAPMVVGLFAIPYLIEGMGTERFGLLAIIWMGVGYFSLFDMGLGRTLTKLVAERVQPEYDHELSPLIWTALYLILTLGMIGATLVLVSSSGLMSILNVPGGLEQEGLLSFRWLAVSIPVVVLSSAMVGLLAARQCFGRIAAVRLPLGLVTFLGPVVTLQFSPSLVPATLVLAGGRVAALLLYAVCAATALPQLKRPSAFTFRYVRPLLGFGGWLTVSSVLGPIMVYFDRFIVGGIIGLTAVTYYVTPYEVLARLQVLPNSLLGVLYPAFTTAFSLGSVPLANLYAKASRLLLIAMLPLLLCICLLAPELLQIWLGPAFREASTPVARWLSAGWLFVLIARIQSNVLQSTGRPDLLAKAHLTELIPYLLLLLILTDTHGITGAAAAWACRGLVDALLLSTLVWKTVPTLRRTIAQSAAVLPGSILAFGAVSVMHSIQMKIVAMLLIVGTVSLIIKHFSSDILRGSRV